MALVEYRKKRHFSQTPEPAGKVSKRRSRRQLPFVIQKHAARRLHYDLRLELDGVLKSWAVPKGPSLDPADKRLAVQVEDHPIEYATFEGQIPAGEYGAGEVIVWDRGTWEPAGDPRRDLKQGRLEFELQGEKLSGAWILLRLKGRGPRDKDNWLLIKRRDDAARPEKDFDVVSERPESVKSGRELGQPASAKLSANAEPRVKMPAPKQMKRRGRTSKRKRLDPADFRVELATLTDKPPPGKGWLHEIKFDGYRLLGAVEPPEARLFTRSQLDWTSHYPAIADAAAELPVESAVLDGELVALDDRGVSRFQSLQNARDGKNGQRLVYFVFDLLYLNGEDLREQPLVERKDRLSELVARDQEGPIRFSDHMAGRGPDFLSECCQRGLEGIVAKRADRPYVAGRTSDWLKIKCTGREELVIGGYTDSTAAGRAFGSLLMGYFDGDKFLYAGRVGTGFDEAILRDVGKRLGRRRQGRSPFVSIPARERGRGVHWVRPELVAQIAFGSWTDDKILRHASFEGLREDKPAKAVERPESLPSARAKSEKMPTKKTTNKPTKKAPADKAPAKKAIARGRTKKQAAPRLKIGRAEAPPRKKDAGPTSTDLPIPLTSPQRVLFPDSGFTKLDLATYYLEIADAILPHVAGRPLSLLRCPEGQGKPCFFQKHAAAGTPDVLRRVEVVERDKTEQYLVVDGPEGLVALAQMSVLEIHPWGSTADALERPDRLIFDLDPGPDVAWQSVADTAVLLRETLERLELTSFVKTTGGKGLHVVAPLTGKTTWPTLKSFAHALAQHLAGENPDLYTAKMAKTSRKGRIFIDYLRNDRGATAVTAYSTRAKPGATVSVPIAWDELARGVRSDGFDVAAVRKRLADSFRDPWKDFFSLEQELPSFAAD